MGTSGFLGFVIDGTMKISFNNGGSYPLNLGRTVLRWLIEHRASLAPSEDPGTTNPLLEQIRALRVFDWDAEPTVEELRWIQDRIGLSDRPPMPWDYLRDEIQCLIEGDLDVILRSGVITDAFPHVVDSLYAEWGYLIDVDAARFEVYRGLQREPHTSGRFAHLAPTNPGYYPAALKAAWPIAALPERARFLEVVGEY
jgi:hypothetical protein